MSRKNRRPASDPIRLLPLRRLDVPGQSPGLWSRILKDYLSSPHIPLRPRIRSLRTASGRTPRRGASGQIDDTVADAVGLARARMPAGEQIPEGRRCAVPGVWTCVECQSARDARPVSSGINRRGSKDSQLRYRSMLFWIPRLKTPVHRSCRTW